MRSGWRSAAVALPLALLAGCNRKPQYAYPPAAAIAPSRPVAQMAELIPPMPPFPAYERLRPVGLDTSVPADSNTGIAEEHPRRARHHAKPAETTQQDVAKTPTVAPATPQPENPQVASGQPSEMSPIGQLSTANGDANTGDRQDLNNQIDATEHTLNGLHRSMSAEEQKTATLVRTFIAKARQALKTDDFDGAKNYSTKANILLQELTKQ